MVSPHKIRYNDISSNELNIDLIIEVAFDSDSGETSSYLNREAVVSETYDGRHKHVTRYKYNESFSPKFTFVKKNFGDFTQEEVRQVFKWLTSKDTTAVLDVFYDRADDSKIIDWSAIGNWTEISTYKLGNNRTVGIVAAFEAVTPYAMSMLHGRDEEDKPIVYDITQNNKITIAIDTDDNKPVYPRITIQQKGTAGDIKITNQHYDSFHKASTPVITTVKNNGQTEKIVIDGANRVISSSNTKRIFGDDFNWQWLPLYDDGKNEITIEGNCEVSIEYREVRKVGEY